MKFDNLTQYELIKKEDLSDIHAEGYLLKHKKSGARVVLIPCEDNNKVFNIAFRTPPKDSTGVAHIIEHTVLCGSKEFPLKDPFVELVKGSLNTFLNAMTYPDKTMYPVASTNDQDFKNLVHVYLDAVFYPNIYKTEKIFRQEGWNYELNSKDDTLKYNGVVYNEMKGVYSSPDEILDRETLNALYPDTPYGVESGGDPEHIPDLTYEEYLNFHRKYYHPSNSYIYLYGDLDMEEMLQFIDEHYLSHFDKISVDSEIPLQKAFQNPVKVEKPYPVSEEESTEGKTYLSYNVCVGDPMDIKEGIAIDVLDYALFSMPGAPVRKALLDAGIGNDVYGNYSDGIQQPYFSIVAKNAEAADADRFLSVIREALEKEVQNGIDRKSIMAGLNYLEFQFREADYQQWPKGLMYGIDLMDSWLYNDNEPFVSLKQISAYQELRRDVENGYFEKLVQEKFLKNSHAALVVLYPERGLAERREAATAKKLAEYKASLSDEELDQMVRNTKELRAYQEAPEKEENLKKLPTLKVSDIRRNVIEVSNNELTVKDIRTIWHETQTNGIGYLDIYWNMQYVPEEYLPYAALLKSILLSVSTKEHTYAELTNEINAHTGGISTELMTVNNQDGTEGYQPYFGIRLKALYQELGTGLGLIREGITSSDFDDSDRILEIINESKSHMQMALQQAGSSFATLRAAAYTSSIDAYADLMSGIGYYHFIRDLADHFEERKDSLKDKLQTVVEMIFRPENILVSFTSEKEGLTELEQHLDQVLTERKPVSALSQTPVTIKPLGLLNEGFTTSGQVQFAAMAGSDKESGKAYTGAMSIFRQIMGYEYLWQKIRVTGGAYGCGASFRRDGMMNCFSYRDPHLGRTREAFLGIPEYLRNFDADPKTMTKYIIGTMSGVDTPLTPQMFGAHSMRCYLTGLTKEERQKARNEILDATPADIRSLADAAETALSKNAFCVIGSEQTIRKEKDLFNHIEQLL